MFFTSMLEDGLAIIAQYKETLLLFSLTSFGLGLFAVRALRLEKFTTGPGLLACFPFGSLVLVVCSYLLAILAHFWTFILLPGSFVLVVLASVNILRHLWTHQNTFRFNPIVAVLTLAVFLLLLIRLSFLAHILMPPYSDSPIHYQAILELLGRNQDLVAKISPTIIFSKYYHLEFQFLTGIQYYHFGFHTLAAWLVSVSGQAPQDVMSLLGQIFLVIGPLAVFALTLTLTSNLPAALLAGSLAAIGWAMPAFAVNWGKYPALLSLAVMPVILSIMPDWRKRRDNWRAILLFGILLLGAVLLHTRILFVFGLAVIAFFISAKFVPAKPPPILQVALRSLAFGLFIWGFLTFLGESYRVLPLWILLLALTPFGIQAHAQLMTVILLFLAGIWLQILLPLPGGQTLFDRPFVEMLLVIPFSLWAGVGLSGLAALPNLRRNFRLATTLTPFLVTLFVFGARGAYLPDPCCNYFTAQDKKAFAWVDENKTASSLFLVATFQDGTQRFGTDAGIWLHPLTRVGVNMLPYDMDWDAPETQSLLCGFGSPQTYLYAGGGQFSFPKDDLARQDWLQVVFQSGQVQIYRANGCLQP
jgi:hypothetical protein